MKPLINIVYAYMTPERIAVDSSEMPYDVVWTKKELFGADAIVYFNGYSYDPHRAGSNPHVFRILCVSEPPSVYPLHYTHKMWRHFNEVLTWNDHLVSQCRHMHYFPVPCYDFPFSAVHGILTNLDREMPDLSARRRAICQIVGDKYSLIPGELYSKRRLIARWFHRYKGIPMDVYGKPSMKVPNYICAPDSKLNTMRQYRYALCFENYTDPQWSFGYVSEKIFDCMFADCIPVYYGCTNIDMFVPPDCFIDFRKFKTLEKLHDALRDMSDEEYLGYVSRMRIFLKQHKPEYRYSCYRLYEKAWELFLTRANGKPAKWPADYLNNSTMNVRMRYGLMRLGLKMYRQFRFVFKVVRSIDSWVKK